MINDAGRKVAAHLAHLIVNRNGRTPNFALLLGAGASATSGISTAGDLIAIWRRMLYRRFGEDKEYHEWLDSQYWHRHEDEYSILFESIYDQPSQRRVFIEECVKDARPNWGYVYLTNLLLRRFFDVVFTTNFDDLLNESCYLYSEGLRPIVAAHDSVVQGIRVTSGRPKIIKLHGDFLYDNIKNTLSELETLEINTKNKLGQFAQEYGLVVVGYSGRDRSVMDTVEYLLRDEQNYKQGVYWCIRRGEEPSDRLKSLLRKDRVYLVEIAGFDEFMADLHTEAKLRLPRRIAQPFAIAQDRLRLFVGADEALLAHRVIGRHIRQVLRSVNTDKPTIPLQLQAVVLSSMGHYDEAIPIWKDAIEQDPEDERTAYGFADALAAANAIEDLKNFIPNSPIPDYRKIYFLLVANQNKEAVTLATEVLSDTDDSGARSEDMPYVRINRAIAYKRLVPMPSDFDGI